VDAENSFGAKIRSDFHCSVSYSASTDDWTLNDLEIE